MDALNLTPRGFGFGLPFSDGGGDENCRRIGEILGRRSNRNPMLVGVGAGDAAKDFARGLERQNWAVLPPELAKLRFISIEKEVLDCGWIKGRLEDLGRKAEEPGLVVGIGDLKGIEELGEDAVDCLVSEMTRVLEVYRARLWVMAWSVTYETYMKFLSRYPTLDKDWDLQLQLITSARPAMGGGLVSRPPSLMESFVPFGGFFPTAYESNIPVMKPYQSSPRCQHCNDKYVQELNAIPKGCTLSHEDQRQANLPSWLRRADMVSMNNPADATKAIDEEKVLNARVVDLQKKWNDHCQRLHQGIPKPEANKRQVLPPIVGLPYISDKDRSINQNIINPGVTQSQSMFCSAPLPSTMGLQKIATASHSISLPLVCEPINKDLISKLQVGLSKGEQVPTEALRSHQSALSDLSTLNDHTSPSTVTPVTTDLVLGTLHKPSCTEELAQCSPSKKVNEFSQHQTHLGLQACLSSSNLSQKFDPSNYKAFYTSFLEKVGRQEAAICAISEAVIRCRAQHERRRGASLKGDIWLSFLGPDRFGKKRVATALAELIFGSRENLICINIGYQNSIVSPNSICDQHEISKCDVRFRGKTVTDHIAGEIRMKPSSVVFLENVDEADVQVQDRLSQAFHTGKISDSHGRELGINNAIFVVTANRVHGKISSPRKESSNFREEKILTAQRWQMKILVEPISDASCRRPNGSVSIVSRQESENRQVVSKRKLDVSQCHKDQQEFLETPKKAHKISNACLDLNQPVEEVVENDIDCSSSSNSGGSDEAWVEEFFNSMDENVNFKPFDFDALADYVLKEIRKRFCDTIGSECLMEIDVKAMEQILAATWLLEDVKDLNSWLENVLVRSFIELRRKYSNKLSARSVIRLVAVEEAFTEDHAPGLLLPYRIILD